MFWGEEQIEIDSMAKSTLLVASFRLAYEEMQLTNVIHDMYTLFSTIRRYMTQYLIL